MDFVYGNDIFNVNRYHTMMTIQHFSNKSKEFKEYWTPDNQSNTVPRLDYNQPANALTDYLMEDGSYLRMREVTIGYSLAPKVLSKLKMSKVRLYATATNLFTLTKYTGYNPDVNTYGNNSGIFNVDFGSYPMYSTFLIGFNVGF
jgi:TonB-dependent starch-binding outer membrane protein SusC